jgi:hypothetical protein
VIRFKLSALFFLGNMRLLEYFCRVGFCLGVGKEGASRTDFWDRRAVVVKPSGSWYVSSSRCERRTFLTM